eukprot:4395882-Amphidinium_carterae.1
MDCLCCEMLGCCECCHVSEEESHVKEETYHLHLHACRFCGRDAPSAEVCSNHSCDTTTCHHKHVAALVLDTKTVAQNPSSTAGPVGTRHGHSHAGLVSFKYPNPEMAQPLSAGGSTLPNQ